MLKLYIGNKNYSSWSMRPWVLLRQSGIPFQEVVARFDSFDADSQFKATLAGVSPTGKVPVLVDGDLTVWDTLAIAEYLAETYPDQQLWPQDKAARARARSVVAEMHSGFAALRGACPMNIEADLAQQGALLWRDRPAVRADVQRLVMVANPAEGRDFGGFMGGWALLWVNDGAIGLEASGTPLDLFGPDAPRPPLSPAADFPPAFMEMAPGSYPQNWTSSADLDVIAAGATNLMEANGRGRIDGVIYADPAALAEFVALTGPIPVPGTGAEINATNTEAFFTRDQFRVLAQNPEGDEALGQLTGEIFDRLGSADLPGPRELGETFGPLVRDGHLAMATGLAGDRALLDRVGLSAPLPRTDGDLLGIVERNKAPNKLDVFLDRTHTYDVAWNAESGARSATLTSTYTNDVGDPSRLPPVVVGNASGVPAGTQIREVSILTPSLTVSLELDGERVRHRT